MAITKTELVASIASANGQYERICSIPLLSARPPARVGRAARMRPPYARHAAPHSRQDPRLRLNRLGNHMILRRVCGFTADTVSTPEGRKRSASIQTTFI